MESVEERTWEWLKKAKSELPLAVVGDLNIWNKIEKGPDAIRDMSIQFSIPMESLMDEMPTLRGKCKSAGSIQILALNCTERVVVEIIGMLDPFSSLILANSDDLVLTEVDLYSTIHINNLTLEII